MYIKIIKLRVSREYVTIIKINHKQGDYYGRNVISGIKA